MRALVVAALAVTLIILMTPLGTRAAPNCISVSGGGSFSDNTVVVSTTNNTAVASSNTAQVNKLVADNPATPTPSNFNTGGTTNVVTQANADPCPPFAGNTLAVSGDYVSSIGPSVMIISGIGLVMISFIQVAKIWIRASVRRNS